MRCYICNRHLEDPEFDNEYKTLPCPDCDSAVNEALADFEEEEFDTDEEDEPEDEDELP